MQTNDIASLFNAAPINALPSKGAMNDAQADATSKDFESMFLSQMLEGMFGESSGSEAFGSSDTDEIYKGLMVQEYGKIITKAGGIGIASNIKQELIKKGLDTNSLLKKDQFNKELLKQQEIVL